MSLIVALGYKDEIELIGDTILTFRSDDTQVHAECGTKIYKLTEQAVLGMVGTGAYAHHLIGDFLDVIFSEEIPTDLIFSKIKVSIDKRIESLSKVDPTYARNIEYLLAGFDSRGQVDLRIFKVSSDYKLTETVVNSSFAGNGAEYKMSLIGAPQYFNEFNDWIKGRLENDPDNFPGSGLEIMQRIIRDPSVPHIGGGWRSYTIEQGDGVTRMVQNSWNTSIRKEVSWRYKKGVFVRDKNGAPIWQRTVPKSPRKKDQS